METVSLRTAGFDRRRRVEEFQAIATHVCKLHIAPVEGAEYRSETVIRILPDLVIADTSHSACITTRTSCMAAETGDNVLIHIPRSGGGFLMRQAGGRELICRPGDIYVDPTEVTGVARFGEGTAKVLYISIPRSLLAGAADTNLRRRLRPSPEWHLFRDYVLRLHRELPHLGTEHAVRHATHVHDLAMLAFGANGDAREIARGRGLRHARLVAFKADIDRHLTSEDLSLGWLAARHGISERYVRALFADEDIGFNSYVAGRRLALAHACLTDPAHAGRSVSQIALAAGFGDISWFNARFRRAFGMTPTEARLRPDERRA